MPKTHENVSRCGTRCGHLPNIRSPSAHYTTHLHRRHLTRATAPVWASTRACEEPACAEPHTPAIQTCACTSPPRLSFTSIDSLLCCSVHVVTASLLVFGFTFCLVVGNMIRGSIGRQRVLRKASALLGGFIALVCLSCFFVAIYTLGSDQQSMPSQYVFALFPLHRDPVSLWVLWPVSLAVCKTAK